LLAYTHQVSTEMGRLQIEVAGIVQGVGFRSFVHRLAHRLSLCGWVRSTGRGVEIEVEGETARLQRFLDTLKQDAPPLASISRLTVYDIPPQLATDFVIADTIRSTGVSEVSPDRALCDDCLAELRDPTNRRYLYPFINCTNCGPRYSIVTGVPFDRTATTMSPFTMCPACLSEYHDPRSRRFNAHVSSCPVCGPHLRVLESGGLEIDSDQLAVTLLALRAGQIVAIKGVGGFHLAVDACNPAAVQRLRLRKQRDEKPFPLLLPDLEAVRRIACCAPTEARLLTEAERPVVLLPRIEESGVAPDVAPGSHCLGVMLPSTPLQHLLFKEHRRPLVMTSGNLSGHPIAYKDEEAIERLGAIADLFLTYNRDIETRTDDSVLRVFREQPLFLRRSRGYVPRGILLPGEVPSVLAVGGDLKTSFCLTRGNHAYLSQHIGDLANAETLASLDESVSHLRKLLEIEPRRVVHDLLPDHLATSFVEKLPLPRVAVQHHHAHLASCMAENRLCGEVIGVIFDGNGHGLDGAIWGGEFLIGGYGGFQRRGHLSYLRMPGGEVAVRQPYRMALAALHRIHGEELFSQDLPGLPIIEPEDGGMFMRMLEWGVNSPLTSSCERLLDAVAALLGVRSEVSYDGQAAMELEALAERGEGRQPYPYLVHDGDPLELDFLPAIALICGDLSAGVDKAAIAAAFHLTLAQAVVDVCSRLRTLSGLRRVALSGGVFQNKVLTEEVVYRLGKAGFQVFCHRLVPPNDGGLALGQAMVAAAQMHEAAL
jgi:hydrogenase maturation protein HypF